MYTTQSAGFAVPVVTPKPRVIHSTETGHASPTNWALVGTGAKKRRAYGTPRLTDGVKYPVTVSHVSTPEGPAWLGEWWDN